MISAFGDSTNTFFKILLDSKEDFDLEYQAIGPFFDQSFNPFEAPFVFNPSGNLLALQSRVGRIDFYKFDRCTGELTYWKSINKPNVNENIFYGMEFSPNGQLFYLSDRYAFNQSRILQYEVFEEDILSTEIKIGETPADSMGFLDLKLGPDAKIYVGYEDVQNWPIPKRGKFLCTIENPDTKGLACNFQWNSLYLNGGTTVGLPNIPNYRLGRLTPAQPAEAGPNQAICDGEFTQLGTPDATGKMIYSWSPPDGLDFPSFAQPTSSPAQTTTYYLTAIDTTICPEYGTSYDSVTVTVKSDCHIQVVPVVTPDGDGLNDHFEIKNLRPGTEVQITDYLGRRVYHSANYQNDWPDGSLVLSQGVYFYWVEDPQEGAVAGRVVVVR
ncbi:MAG: gliding motility-associated C-terminal domain-containing protein [Bacteroidia bacterium]|nr:gliding motility-associated C-terminal domain-containing protein [Bacteroidia bacterium]